MIPRPSLCTSRCPPETPSLFQLSASTHRAPSLPASLAATTPLRPRPHTHTLRYQTDHAHCPTLNRKHCGPSVCCRTVCYPPYRLPGRQPANRQTISTISREPQRQRPILPRVSRLYGCKGTDCCLAWPTHAVLRLSRHLPLPTPTLTSIIARER
jgi:hypothetical protein